MCRWYEQTVPFFLRLILSILDHVISFPPIILPVKEMASVCKKVSDRSILCNRDLRIFADPTPSQRDAFPGSGGDHHDRDSPRNYHWHWIPNGLCVVWNMSSLKAFVPAGGRPRAGGWRPRGWFYRRPRHPFDWG